MTIPLPYRHIIWDWNGTLFNDAWLCVAIMNNMLARRDLPALTLAHYETIFDFPVEDYYRLVGFNFITDPFSILSDEFIDEYNRRVTECRLRRGARETLDRAQALGLTQSILSAMEQTNLDRLVEHFGLRQYFTDVVGLADHHARGKVETGKAWIAGQSVAPDEMVFVGDTVHDGEVAEALGAKCLHIYSGHHSRERLAATGAPILAHLGEVFVATA